MEPYEDEEEMTFVDQFKQQMLKAWQPVPTLTKTILLFTLLAVVFLGMGIPMYIFSTNVVEYEVKYSSSCAIGATCTLNLEIGTEMQSPVFVYYELHNFFQNHRLYSSSLSNTQIEGNSPSVSDVFAL